MILCYVIILINIKYIYLAEGIGAEAPYQYFCKVFFFEIKITKVVHREKPGSIITFW